MRQIFRDHYEAVFGRPWPLWSSGLLVGFLNVLMFAYAKPWSASDGVRNWGDWILGMEADQALSPLLYSTSLTNLGLILGSMGAAFMARQFYLRVPPGPELIKGLIGGTLMGSGASLALSCNIGGFFSATAALSLSGVGMMLGLFAGAFLGSRYLIWEVFRHPQWAAVPPHYWGSDPSPRRSHQPWIGLGLLAVILAAVFAYDRFGFPERGGLLLMGTLLGIVNQRSRLCFVRAFREPFSPNGDTSATRGVILAVLVSLTGFSILKWTALRLEEAFVFPSVWMGSILGGTIFGIGMTLAGGCAAGSLWRAGEGQVKLWLAVVGFALSASLTRRGLELLGLIDRLGDGVFLPDVVGWSGAIGLVLGILALWYVLATWKQARAASRRPKDGTKFPGQRSKVESVVFEACQEPSSRITSR